MTTGFAPPVLDRARLDALLDTARPGPRLSVIDRQWTAASVEVVVGPIKLPARNALLAAVRQLAEHALVTRVGWLRAPGQARWSLAADLAAFADAVIVEFPELDRLDAAQALVAARAVDRAALPFVFFVGRQKLVLSISHALGDGFYMTRLISALLSTARTGSAPSWVSRQPVGHPLAGGAWRAFARQPHRARKLWRDRVPVSDAAPDAASGGPENGSWEPHLACRYGSVAREQMVLLKKWRVAHASGLSLIPVSIAVTEIALRRLRVPTTRHPLVLFDARRYLDERAADVSGNFSAGLRLRFADPGDPRTVDAALKTAVASGRPLAVIGLGMRRNPLRGIEKPAVDRFGQWDVAYSHMGRPMDSSRFDWHDSPGVGREYLGLLEPAGPNGVTIGFTEVDNRLTMFLSFHDNVIDGDLAQRVIDLVCADPVALLEHERLRTEGKESTR